jgi:hypothetical protein
MLQRNDDGGDIYNVEKNIGVMITIAFVFDTAESRRRLTVSYV